jgi:stage III sporulation protein AG
MWKFKSLKGKDKWLFLVTIGVILCILAFPADRIIGAMDGGKHGTAGEENKKVRTLEAEQSPYMGNSEEQDSYPVSAKAREDYEAELERRVRELLKDVEGVGAVDVMIVLKSTSEKVIHVDGNNSYSLTEEKDSSGGTRKIENQEQGQTTVLISGGGESTPIIEKELYPELSGIIISAQGGDSPLIQAEISTAMEALFGLPAHKIKVLKRVE